ncbi:MAG: hypothetical protein H6546_03920 [Chitinophagales bacterium]|nr:hypothetical protein [Saprospiraceae bacterium]MCB9019455.1 hypothetical protein [Chitinophagales bacterium]MCB9312601.1 hypothetical protein [Lewinellaceae bacterium]HRW74505.1 hypothetical protein [Saprospiraceae bacterium]
MIYTGDNARLRYDCPDFRQNPETARMCFAIRKAGLLDHMPIPEERIRFIHPKDWAEMSPYCLPLYMGTQFGVFPREPEEDAWRNAGGRYAIFCKSLLSGAEAGLKVHLNGRVLGPYWTIQVADTARRSLYRIEPSYDFRQHDPLRITPKLIWVDEDHVSVRFWTLVVRLDRLNALAGPVAELVERLQGGSATNGRLWWMSEMNHPPNELKRIREELLKPLGLVDRTDFVLLEEQMYPQSELQEGHLIGKPVPGLADVEWLESRILPTGNQIVRFRSRPG